MDTDGNTYALNKYLDGIDAAEAAQENFEASIQDELQTIDEAIKSIMHMADNYEGYDMMEVARDIIKEYI